MTRAVLLPAGADPFLNAYWLRHYRTWADEVDELHVAVCGPIPDDVLAYTKAMVADVPHATMTHFPRREAHGQVLTYLLGTTQADHVLLIEDDAFIRTPSAINDAFMALELHEHDLIGCPRDGYASANVIAAAHKEFGPEVRGLAFWPCFLFTSREALEATDRLFDGKVWAAGDTVLGETLVAEGSADTFIWASYQLRAQGLDVSLRDGFRLGDPIPPDAPWFHVGSLSSGHGWSWLNPASTYEWRLSEIRHWALLPRGETVKRMAWWQRVWDHWDGAIPDYHEAYGEGIRQFMADFSVSQGDVDFVRASFDYLVTWAES
jgi:hypothetical protein